MANENLGLVLHYYVEVVLGQDFKPGECCGKRLGADHIVGNWDVATYGTKPTIETVMAHEAAALVWSTQTAAKKTLKIKLAERRAMELEPVLYAAEIAACETECTQIKLAAGL